MQPSRSRIATHLGTQKTGRLRPLRVLVDHARPLSRLVASDARSSADRADLLQDIALAIWLSLPGFRGACSERTFVLRAAHNRALTFLSKRGALTEPRRGQAGTIRPSDPGTAPQESLVETSDAQGTRAHHASAPRP